MSIKTVDEKFQHELQDAYDAEHQFLEGMQEMSSQVSDGKLKGLLSDHIRETKDHIANLEQVFKALGQEAKRVKCDGAAGLVSEARKSVKEAAENPAVLDCVIGSALSKAEHYEISSYRGLVMGAEMMGNQEVSRLLHQNLQREEQMAQLIEENAPKLLRKAMEGESRERGA